MKFDVNEISLFTYYPQFREDIDALFLHKIITRELEYLYKWNYSLTSLGEYFKSIKPDYCTNSHWKPIETIFGVKTGKLRNLVSKNGREFKRDKSRDFEKIIEILGPHRERLAAEKKILDMYNKIKNLIEETDPKTREERERILKNIRNILG